MKKLSIAAALLFAFGTVTFAQTATGTTAPAKGEKKSTTAKKTAPAKGAKKASTKKAAAASTDKK